MTIDNKTVWTLWLQGFGVAPEVVKLSLESWRRLNPEWKIEALDRHALIELTDDVRHIIDVGRKDITLQKIAAIGRLSLLRRFGGVWADATVFCRQPLDEWLAPYTESGFFAFRNPGSDRLMANWFIAANRDDVILTNLYREFVAFWENNNFSNQNSKMGKFAIRVLTRLLRKNPRRTGHWLSFVPTKVLRVHPYSIFHYVFNTLALDNDEVRTIWNAGRPLEAGPAHVLKRLASHPNGVAIATDHIERATSPVYKLDWEVDATSPYWRAVLSHLTSKLP